MENILRTSRQTKPRLYLLSPEKALRYTVEFLLLLLFSSAGKFGFALSLGLLVGLTYARQNLAITAPLYFIAGVVFMSGWWTFLHLAVPPLLLAAIYFVCWRLKRNVPLFVTAISGAVAIVPYLVTNAISGADVLPLAVSLIIAVLFSLCCSIACYAMLFRGIKCRFTLDERIASGLFAVACSYAAYSLNLFGFRLYWLIMPAVILLFSEERNAVGTLVLSVLTGLGAAVFALDIAPLGAVVLVASAALAVKPFTRFASASAMTAMLLCLWLLGINGCNWQGAVLAASGLIVFCVLPPSVRKYFSGGEDSNAAALNALVNRNRTELSDRLSAVGAVFADMSDGLSVTQDVKGLYTAKRLASEVAKSYCGRCENKANCFSALGGDTSPVLEPMASAVLARGKTTILDIPTFITSRCNKMNNLTAVVNNAGEAYRARAACAEENLSAKRLLAEQFAGMSLVLDALSKECGEHISFGQDVPERLESELLKHNIVARETIVAGRSDGLNVSLTVRECDATKAVLPRVVSKCMKTRLSVCEVLPKGEDRIVRLTAAPLYEVAYGIAEKKRAGEDVSGDNKAVLTPSATKRIFAVLDGMGGGEDASKASGEALKMVENFYRAGFDNALILSMVNKLLCLGGDDGFAALDIAVLDTASGGLDVIKLGAAPGFLVRRDSIDVINSSTPPAGILERVEPITDRYQMYDGDMLIIASDGVVDALGERGVVEKVEELSTVNPQTLADSLLFGATAAGATDDCTVVVLRLIAV